MNPWNYLAMFILGLIIFEVASRIIVQFEAKGDYSSITYNTLIWIAATGAALGLCSILRLCKNLEAILTKISKYQIKTSKIDTSLFSECKKAISTFFRRLRKL